MKLKHLFFTLLFSVVAFAQTKTGQEQEFDYGIVNNAAQTVTSPVYIVPMGLDGTLGKMSPLDLPVSTATQVAIDGKVSDTIRDGINAIAPSENAVFKALATKENTVNKTDSFASTSTTTYPSSKALSDGLAAQLPALGLANNVIPKSNGAGAFVATSITDNGSLVNISSPTRLLTTTAASEGFNSNFTFTNTGFIYGIASTLNVTGATSSSANGYSSRIISVATTNQVNGYRVLNSITTGGGSISSQFGFRVDNLTTGGSNFGFRGDVNESANSWNIHMAGTAKNYFNGATLFGTTTNDGVNKAQVVGGLKTDILRISTTPTTSAGAHRLLSYNETSDQVESIPSNTYVTTVSPAFTGTPTAPTAATGTNTNQIATTAFVLANSGTDNVKLTGNQTVNGTKSFTSGTTFFGNQITHHTDNNPSNPISWSIQDLAPSQGAFSLGTNTVKLSMREAGPRYISVTDPIESPAGTASNHLVNKSQLDNVKPYKVYNALISQTGTSAPTVTVLENTLGGSIVWSYNSTGSFTGTRASAFTNLKTAFFSTPTVGTDVTIGLARMNDNEIELTTTQSGGLTNGLLNLATIEIRVYN